MFKHFKHINLCLFQWVHEEEGVKWGAILEKHNLVSSDSVVEQWTMSADNVHSCVFKYVSTLDNNES